MSILTGAITRHIYLDPRREKLLKQVSGSYLILLL